MYLFFFLFNSYKVRVIRNTHLKNENIFALKSHPNPRHYNLIMLFNYLISLKSPENGNAGDTIDVAVRRVAPRENK